LAKAFLPSGATDGADGWSEATISKVTSGDGSSNEGRQGFEIRAISGNMETDEQDGPIHYGLQFGFKTKEGEVHFIGPMWKFGLSNITPVALNDAIAEFRAAIRLAPQDPAIHMDLAHALVLREEYDAAVKEHQLAVQIDPTYPQKIRNGLEYTLYLKGELIRAIELINQKIAWNPTVVDYKFLGLLYHEQGQKELAFSAYREALLRSEQAITARDASTVMETGKPEEVIAFLQDLIKAHPQNEEIRESLEIMLKRQDTSEQ
jgi:tetratricopeptide (TPR) repeat protein